MVDLLVGCMVERHGNNKVVEGLVIRTKAPPGSSLVWVMLENGELKVWDIINIKVKKPYVRKLHAMAKEFSFLKQNVEELADRFDLMDLEHDG